LAAVVSSRRTTAQRLRHALSGRTRIAGRQFLDGVLDDIEHGTCSVLEHGYLTRVERPHGLPAGSRQVRESNRRIVYRDVTYDDQSTFLELDGRLVHDDPEGRDSDLERDLDAAVDGRSTIRLGWGQVYGRPCMTAVKVGAVLRARGWPGATTSCPACVGC
jgi:hypothetical protein